jgi:hypothetical protein
MGQNNLLDFLQGASNSVASNVSAPVDGIAWLLRKAGLPIPTNPVGGSDWMAQRGLTAEPQNKIAGLLGESIGGVAPMLAAAKAPQIAKGLLQGADNLAAPRTLNPQTGAIVWHGSPHKFDKFDASKIGTGEGAQAYGHGLYLAESPSVAREYQEKLSSTGGAKNLASQFGDVDGGIAEATKRIEHYKKLIADGGGGDLRRANGMLSIAQKNLDDLSAMKAGLPENTGALYKVDLPDEHIAKMLDWDKPLSQQHPDVQKALQDYDALGGKGVYHPDATGQQIYNRIGDKANGKDAAENLRWAGIPGIRYLDGGSRGTGAGTSNFVVFPGNEGLLSILERNGQPVNKLSGLLAK